MNGPTRFLLDEHLRGPLFDAIGLHNALPDAEPLIAFRVGDFPDLPLGVDDRAILRWAEREGCILLTSDQATMASHFRDHLAAGGHSPGIFFVPKVFSLPVILDCLVLAAHVAVPSEWLDRRVYLPALA